MQVGEKQIERICAGEKERFHAKARMRVRMYPLKEILLFHMLIFMKTVYNKILYWLSSLERLLTL